MFNAQDKMFNALSMGQHKPSRPSSEIQLHSSKVIFTLNRAFTLKFSRAASQ